MLLINLQEIRPVYWSCERIAVSVFYMIWLIHLNGSFTGSAQYEGGRSVGSWLASARARS